MMLSIDLDVRDIQTYQVGYWVDTSPGQFIFRHVSRYTYTC